MHLDSDALNELWQPRLEALQAISDRHPTAIRVHRALTWLAEAEVSPLEDVQLMLRWVSLNALYGQWNRTDGVPAGDRASLTDFVSRVWAAGAGTESARLPRLMEDHRDLVLEILDNNWLTGWFWRDPSVSRADSRTPDRRGAPMLYAEGKHEMLFDRTLGYVYFLRCQLIHGAATANSGMNRASVEACNRFLAAALSAVLEVIIRHGSDLDWGPACYPPVDG